jgi:plastocyanin
MSSPFSSKYFLLLLFCLFAAHNFAFSQQPTQIKRGSASISGTVSIPAGGTQQRVFRGRAYRSSGTVQAENDAKSTPSKNTIISAVPLSFDADSRPLSEPVRIRQENANFIPHITPVTVGSTVEFVNNDPFYHNVFSLTPGAKFNVGRRPTGDVVSQKVPRLTGEVEVTGLGEIELFCDIHSSMNAKVLSLDTPYYVRVKDDGTYELTDLPEGRYELRAYNPGFQSASAELQVGNGKNAEQDFNLSK